MRLFNLVRRPSRSAPVRRARLSLEALAERWVPDGNLNETLYLAPIDNPPVIVNFEAVEVGDGLFNIDGTVRDEDPAGLTVTFHGPQAAIDGKTATTWNDGHFSITVQFQTDGTDSGTITARTADRAGHPSNVVQQYITP